MSEFRFDNQTDLTMDQLMGKTNSSSRGEVLKKALALLWTVTEIRDDPECDGPPRVYIQREGEDRKEIIL